MTFAELLDKHSIKTIKYYVDEISNGNAIDNAYLLNGERIRDCFRWGLSSQYAIITFERGYREPLLISDELYIPIVIK